MKRCSKNLLSFFVLGILFLFIVSPIYLVSAVSSIRVGVYYYPWYDEGLGNRHWNYSVSTAVVDTPIKGFYNSCSYAIINWHLGKMVYAGIDFVILSWWGANSYEDNASKIVFSVINANYSTVQATIMVEPFNHSGQYDFDAMYSYIYDNYVKSHPNVYLRLYNKPLVLFYNDENMTTGAFTLDNRFESRITGHQYYTNWVYWSVETKTWSPWQAWAEHTQPLCMDGEINVLPRMDDSYLNRTRVVQFDVDYSEGLYDKQWSHVISLARQGQVNIVTISTWNEYHERTQIEPCIDKTSTYGGEPDYLLEKTKDYITQLHSPIANIQPEMIALLGALAAAVAAISKMMVGIAKK